MIPSFSNALELINRFPTEKSCHEYLAERRWAGYMECPKCSFDKAYVFKDGIRYKCKSCKYIYTAISKTIFESSKLPLQKWFFATYLIMHKKGISSIQLAKDIGVTQKTAWFILQRLRTALGNHKEEKLSGDVELDETYVGGKNKNRHFNKKVKYSQGRSYKDKTPVFGMMQRNGRLIAMTVSSSSAKVLRPLIYHHIEQGSTLMTDEFNVYKSVESNYNRKIVEHGKGKYVNGDCYTNGLEGFWSHVKRGIIGIYHQTSRKHLNKYIQEFTFKYNYRSLAIQDSMNLAFSQANCRLKYKDLIQ